MKLDKTKIKSLLWITPAIVAFLIALIPTLKFQWPLTVDIFYHIHIAQVYSQYGLTLVDPLIDPGMGQKIGYPPLFSLFIVFLGSILKINYFQVARLLQPILAFSVVFSVSYVAKKFYGDIAGISAGFLLISSFLFSRLVSPLPETMALIIVPLAVYSYYKSVKDKNYLYAFLSGFMFLIVVATHQAATMILFLIMTAIAVVMTLLRRKIRFFTSYLAFLAVPVGLGLLAAAAVFVVAPSFASSILTQGLTAVTGLTTSLPNSELISNLKYVAYLGIVLLFAFIGGIFALKKIRDQDIILFIWIVVGFLISESYWFGIHVYTIRLLVYILLPLSILAGLGLSYLYTDFKKKEFPSPKVRSGFLIVTFVIATLFAIITVEDPNLGLIPKYDTAVSQNGIKSPQIAPPTESDVELANWFKENGDKKSVIISNNYYTDQFLLATTGQPIGSIQSAEHCIFLGFKKSELISKNIGYFIYDKRLTSSSSNKTITKSTGVFLFFNTNYNIKSSIPSNLRLVYENKNYYVFETGY